VQTELARPRQGRGSAPAVAVFLAIVVIGVFIAKWDPYALKLGTVAATHTLGPSIVTGTGAAAPPVGWASAWDYFVAYFKDIWIALVVGLAVGAGVETLLPEGWLARVLGRASWGQAAGAAAAAVPSMMCTCCSAPIAVGLQRSRASTGAVLAYWVGNPVLNPATIVFMGFVLGWDWALVRIVVGLAVVAGAVYIGNRWGREGSGVPDLPAALAAAPPSVGRYFRALGRLAVRLLPEYLVIVGLLGAVRTWLFPAMDPALGHSLWLAVGLAAAGTLFVIPTAGEVPIVQTLMSYGLSVFAAGTLMMTLPAVSLPSAAMVSQAVPRAVIWRLLVWVAVMGLVTGAVARLVV
jgi:uncharacterized membrane protein YraQ (UPF0718 family)